MLNATTKRYKLERERAIRLVMGWRERTIGDLPVLDCRRPCYFHPVFTINFRFLVTYRGRGTKMFSR